MLVYVRKIFVWLFFFPLSRCEGDIFLSFFSFSDTSFPPLDRRRHYISTEPECVVTASSYRRVEAQRTDFFSVQGPTEESEAE